MGDSENRQPFAPPVREESGRKWLPMAIGGVLVVVAVVVIIFVSRTDSSSNANQLNPYAAKLQVDNLHMATAENFAGGSVTYIQGHITNSGDKKVTGTTVQVLFKNSLGELAQKETLPMMVLMPNTPYVDYGPMQQAPLAAGQGRDFRLTLEHVTADWDGQMPAVKVVSVTN
ncbi:MAG TPA: hypothetical protein VJV96_14250 [Candidatus Angelobacter sp.]|nr:hypothetical protein [Candidatus Angelobacter sp.]